MLAIALCTYTTLGMHQSLQFLFVLSGHGGAQNRAMPLRQTGLTKLFQLFNKASKGQMDVLHFLPVHWSESLFYAIAPR